MNEVIVFFEDSNGERQVFQCPELPEAPRGSLFHKDFDFKNIEVRKTVIGADFYNQILRGTSASVRLSRSDEAITIAVVIVENEIRSFQVFKNIEFDHISLSRIEKGFKVGFEAHDQEVYSEFSLRDLER